MYQHEWCAFFVVDDSNRSFEIVELSSTRFATCNKPFKNFLIICIKQSCVPNNKEKIFLNQTWNLFSWEQLARTRLRHVVRPLHVWSRWTAARVIVRAELKKIRPCFNIVGFEFGCFSQVQRKIMRKKLNVNKCTCIVELESARYEKLVCTKRHGHIYDDLRCTRGLASLARTEKILDENASRFCWVITNVHTKQQP